MENEWSLKPWENVIAIHHSNNFCQKESKSSRGGFTWGMAYKGVCFSCKKPIPEHILIQWKLGGYGPGSEE